LLGRYIVEIALIPYEIMHIYIETIESHPRFEFEDIIWK
jgi:hypothetical protein